MVLLFTIGITVCFIAAMFGHSRTGMSMSPAFLPDRNVLRQILRIAFISPWAFIGFESVSHSAAEYKFKHGNMFRILFISAAVTTALYIFVILLSVSSRRLSFEVCSSFSFFIFLPLLTYRGIKAVLLQIYFKRFLIRSKAIHTASV